MIVLAFRAQNFQILSVIEIRPDGALVPIKGFNAQGKTSLLNGLWATFAGKSVVPVKPIRDGEEVAILQAELGEQGGPVKFIVTRSFKRGYDEEKQPTGDFTQSIKVTDGEGLPYTKGVETLLKTFFSTLTFDPLSFYEMDETAQFEMLGRMFLPGINFDRLERQYDADFEARAEVNKKHKEAKAHADALVVPEDPPGDKTDVDELVKELQGITEYNDDLRERAANRIKQRERAEMLVKEADRYEREAADADAQIAALAAKAAQVRVLASGRRLVAAGITEKLEGLRPLPEPKKSEAIAQRIADAQTTNRAIEEWARDRDLKQQRVNQWKSLTLQALELTKKMVERENATNEAVAQANIPVPGLTFGPKKTLLLQGQPLAQASDGQRLQLSLEIGMALNPELKIMRIRNLNVLDKERMRFIAAFAEKRRYQVWGEWVTHEEGDGPAGFVLEEGHLKGQQSQAPKKLAREKKA